MLKLQLTAKQEDDVWVANLSEKANLPQKVLLIRHVDRLLCSSGVGKAIAVALAPSRYIKIVVTAELGLKILAVIENARVDATSPLGAISHQNCGTVRGDTGARGTDAESDIFAALQNLDSNVNV